jgi:hypothetical protein
MHLSEILDVRRKPHLEQLFLLRNSCSEYLHESKGLPIFKQIPAGITDSIARIKVRHKSNPINKYFGESVLQSSNGGKTIIESRSSPYPAGQNFWMFPINGYRYLYSPEVQDYRSSIKHILEQTSDQDIIREMVQEMHISTNLVEGIASATEILWYGISSYYAVDCSSFMDYNELLTLL